MQAMIVASTLAILSLILPPISIVSSATVALVTLRRGAFEGFYVLAFSCVAAGLLSALIIGTFQFALVYGIVFWLPVWLISIVLRETRSLSLALQAAVLLGIVGLIGFYIYNPQLADIWKGISEQKLPEGTPASALDLLHFIGAFARYMAGIITVSSVFSLLLGLFFGRWWQALLYNPGGFKQEYLTLSASPKLTIATGLLVLLAVSNASVISEVSWNIIIVLFVMYMCIGTAILHKVFSNFKHAKMLVPLFYTTVFFIQPAMIPVALIGLIDPWMNLRNKFSNQHTPDGV